MLLNTNKTNLKSNQEALRKRGLIDHKDMELYFKEKDDVLYQMIQSNVATERTVAIHLLAERYQNDIGLEKVILESLSQENSLYTKIEICSILERGNEETAKIMVKYLGLIGDNQYKELPDRVSKKVSYPLPRDIIARTLANMSPIIYEILLEVLVEDNPKAISEVLDAIGYMAFYNKQLVTPVHAEVIYGVMENYKDDQVVFWKAVQCLSAFPLEGSVIILEEIIHTYPNTIFSEEAERSIKLIRNKGTLLANN